MELIRAERLWEDIGVQTYIETEVNYRPVNGAACSSEYDARVH
jgi:hypothetical protein